MVNYENGIIYKLCCKDPSIKEIYIGSTCSFKARKQGHKNDCNDDKRVQYNYYVYKFIRSNGGFNNFDMVVVENYKATDKKDLHTRERYWLETLQANLNKYNPTVSIEETKERAKEYSTDYRKTHKEDLREKAIIYQTNNREEILAKKKIYGEENKERVKERVSKPYTCICGSVIRWGNKSQHEKSIKHQTFLQLNINN